jgi:hypothetical protein
MDGPYHIFPPCAPLFFFTGMTALFFPYSHNNANNVVTTWHSAFRVSRYHPKIRSNDFSRVQPKI